jgi:hypothetical protein
MDRRRARAAPRHPFGPGLGHVPAEVSITQESGFAMSIKESIFAKSIGRFFLTSVSRRRKAGVYAVRAPVGRAAAAIVRVPGVASPHTAEQEHCLLWKLPDRAATAPVRHSGERR